MNGDLNFDGKGIMTNPGIVTIYINAGTTTFTGEAKATCATLVVNGGTLAAGTDNAWGAGAVQINSGALKAASGTNPTVINDINVGGNFSINGVNDLTLSGNIYMEEMTRTITVNNTGVTTLSGVVSSGGLIKEGAGTLVLSGENGTNVPVGVTDGTLVAANDKAVGFALELAGGTLEAGGKGDRTLASSVSVKGDSYIHGVASNDLILTGNISMENVPVLTVSGTGNVTLTGAINGSGELDMTSTGILALSKADNPYTGTTNVNSGTLASGADNAIGKTGITNINSNAKVDIGGYHQTFATLNGEGELTGTGVMTIGTGDFSGLISGAGQVAKDTAGTLTLSRG